MIKEKRQTFKGQAWITQDAPISLKDQLIPVFDILCTFNDLPWFDNLRKMLTFIPSGFPVRIDVPLFYVLTARVTFENINAQSGDGVSRTEERVRYFLIFLESKDLNRTLVTDSNRFDWPKRKLTNQRI